MKPSPPGENIPIVAKMATAGMAGCTADLFTFPLDTIKVWLQVKGESTKSGAIDSTGKKSLKAKASRARFLEKVPHLAATRKSTTSTVSNMVKTRASTTLAFSELPMQSFSKIRPQKKAQLSAFQTIFNNLKTKGVGSMYSGLTAGLQRQLGFCSVRIGLYDQVKQFYFNLFPAGSPDSKMFLQRILAGGTTGILAVCIFQPTELVKIRMQAEKGRYTGSLQAYRHLFKTGGIREAWQGLSTNCARTATVNICELVTYDIVKDAILKRDLMQDRMPCHFVSAFISGFVTTMVASPVDVVKTRFMNSAKATYTSPIQCATHMLKSEGFMAFYKGFIPSYLRLGSWNIVMFVSFEQYKTLYRTYFNSRKTKDV